MHRLFGFTDGENLVHRYEAMLKNGSIPKPDVIHIPGLLVWHPAITKYWSLEIMRFAFYQTVVGSEDAVNQARAQVSSIGYNYTIDTTTGGKGTLYPRLFKKQKKGSKTKSVDINITVDILRTVINRTGDIVFLLSGDGDYLPLVEEVNRHGKQVWVGAFSSGLSQDLRFAADDFFDLDLIFFEPTQVAP